MIKHIVAIVILTIVVIAVGIYGIKLSGTPSENKAVRYDEIRIRDFGSIRTAIESYYQDNVRLPASLDLLLAKREKTLTPYLKKLPTDPKTKLAYSYTPIGTAQYKICATFETSSDSISQRKTGVDPVELNSALYGGEDTSHPKGDHCFDRTISTYLQQQYDSGTLRSNSVLDTSSPPPAAPIQSTSSAF